MKRYYIKDIVEMTMVEGQKIELYGWIASIRKLKSDIFFEMEDSTGRIAVQMSRELIENPLKPEQSVRVVGVLGKDKIGNPQIKAEMIFRNEIFKRQW